jgi:hypothetical protein
MQVLVDKKLLFDIIYTASRCVGYLDLSKHQFERNTANELWDTLQEVIRTYKDVVPGQQCPCGLDKPEEV